MLRHSCDNDRQDESTTAARAVRAGANRAHKCALHFKKAAEINKKAVKASAKRAKKSAKKAADTTKKSVKTTVKAVVSSIKAIVSAASSPAFWIVALIVAVVISIFVIMGSLAASVAGSGVNGLSGAVYLASERDIDDAELRYTELEADLKFEIMRIERTKNGFDEYRYNIGDFGAVGHDPFALIAYLTARYGEFTYIGVKTEIASLFSAQCKLTYFEQKEIRYRTQTLIGTRFVIDEESDDEVEEEYEYTIQVPYDWCILTITLTVFPLENIIFTLLNSEQKSVYETLMQSRGGRQLVGNPFDSGGALGFGWLSCVANGYGYHCENNAKILNGGVDLNPPSGTKIYSASGGKVTSVTTENGRKTVVIAGSDGIVCRYVGLGSVSITNGQTVSQGAFIGTTSGVLRFEVIADGRSVNPLFFAETGG